jgi:hypothetical protein
MLMLAPSTAKSTVITAASHWDSSVEPAGAIKSVGQAVEEMELTGQYVLMGHCTWVEGVAQ